MLAEVLAEAGDAAGSDKLYVGLLAAQPDDPELLVSHGQNLLHLLQVAEALAAFDKATRLDAATATVGAAWRLRHRAPINPRSPSTRLPCGQRYLPELPSTYFWGDGVRLAHDKAAAVTYYHHFLDASAESSQSGVAGAPTPSSARRQEMSQERREVVSRSRL